jgi:MFS family permease
LTSVLYRQSFIENLRQVLCGIQAGLITPAKIGEPIGKALLMKKGNRKQGLILSVAGSFFQNFVIIFTGLIAILFFNIFTDFQKVFFNIPIEKINYFAIWTCVVVITLLLVIYALYLIFKKNKHIKRWRYYIQIIKKLKMKINLKLFLLTMSRYIVFSFQLCITLIFFDIINAPLQVWLIPIYYLVITFIPIGSFVDLGVKGSAAVIIFSSISNNIAGIISSVFIVWFFNIVIPSLTSIFILRPKKIL